MSSLENDTVRRSDTETVEKVRPEFREPPLFRVLLHNDHYTTMDFVIEVLRGVFRKSIIEATKIMLDVHRKGVGVVGAFTYDIARTRADRVHAMARKREFPLRCSVEKV